MTSPRGPVPHLPPVDPAYLRRGPGRAKTLTLGALGLGAVGACVWGLVVAAGAFRHDPLELIDSDPMYEALAAPCAAIQEAAARVDPAAPAVERAARLAGVVTTIDDLAASVAALPEDVVEDDIPTRGWVADWETFGSRLTDYSTALASGTETELDTPPHSGRLHRRDAHGPGGPRRVRDARSPGGPRPDTAPGALDGAVRGVTAPGPGRSRTTP